MRKENYYTKRNIQDIDKINELLDCLPPFCQDYFLGIEPRTSCQTRLKYAYDLRIFFDFLCKKKYRKKDTLDLTLEDLEGVTNSDIELFLSYLSHYHFNDRSLSCDEKAKARKLSAVRAMFKYFFNKGLIEVDNSAKVQTPKLHEKEIIRLEPNEVAILLDQVEDGTKLTKKELEYHKKTKLRDVALLTLLLGTGIRVSECVGLDINDVDFDNGGIKIRRKGGYEAIVYFGDEVETALLDYLEQREHIIPAKGHENALFLSLQNRRMAVRSVENLVKKYASRVTTLKKITPHKLRSTYGTELYKETGDIYLVADVLGHKDVNTTRKHYAALEEQRRKQAANAFHLREHSDRHSEHPDN